MTSRRSQKRTHGINAAAWFYSQSFHSNIDSSLESGGSSQANPTTKDVSQPSAASAEEGEGGELASPSQEGKFTPGPWYFDQETETVRVREWKRNMLMGDYRGCIIAGFEQSHGGIYRRDSIEGVKETVIANAHLIAAAPRMYEALRKVADNFSAIARGEKQPHNEPDLWVEMLRVLRAAEGKEGDQ